MDPRVLYSIPSKSEFSYSSFVFPRGISKQCRVLHELTQETVKIEFVPLFFMGDMDAPYLYVAKFKANPLTFPFFAHTYSITEIIEGILKSRCLYSTDVCICIRTKVADDELAKNLFDWIVSSEYIVRSLCFQVIDAISSGREYSPPMEFIQLRAKLQKAVKHLVKEKMIEQGRELVFDLQPVQHQP